jgi:D-alanine-D-alanine ligase
MTDFIVPAPMDDALKKEVEALAVETSNLVDLSGYGRVDMMLTEDGPFILEVNTLPGMTSTSDLPAMARSMGMDFDDLVLTLLKTGRRHFGELKA